MDDDPYAWDDADEYGYLFCQICSSWVEIPCEDYLESIDCDNVDSDRE